MTTTGNDWYQEAFSICIAESTPPSHLLIILVVLLLVIWWSLAVLTTNMLKRRRHQHMHDAFFSVSRLMEIRQSEPSSEQQLELTESQQESPFELFPIKFLVNLRFFYVFHIPLSLWNKNTSSPRQIPVYFKVHR
ncbi:hypothetical protein LSH36_427g00013 [Paralvinella palmiformis]|uniref:Uncharacterized protein n=1 Tax=Paralvinella palmiformis TaxID=53620 RepID=A0AAD9JBG2_9ANNE|nr:hypothetical protein LSH36_427g00013 [Paralvinella palmiformis]